MLKYALQIINIYKTKKRTNALVLKNHVYKSQ